jgi:hypothetical protein
VQTQLKPLSFPVKMSCQRQFLVYKNAVAKVGTRVAPSHHPFLFNKMVAPPVFHGGNSVYISGMASAAVNYICSVVSIRQELRNRRSPLFISFF